MRTQIIEPGWYSRPDLNGAVADALDEIAEGSARVNYNSGICWALQQLMKQKLADNPVNGYDFVASVSNHYGEFYRHTEHRGHRWHGQNGEFRINWCRKWPLPFEQERSLPSQLRQEIDQLVAEDAPASVVVAAEESVRCAETGLKPPAHLGQVLMDYATRRAAQNRYGKNEHRQVPHG